MSIEEAWNDFQNDVVAALPHGERGKCISCAETVARTRSFGLAVLEEAQRIDGDGARLLHGGPGQELRRRIEALS